MSKALEAATAEAFKWIGLAANVHWTDPHVTEGRKNIWRSAIQKAITTYLAHLAEDEEVVERAAEQPAWGVWVDYNRAPPGSYACLVSRLVNGEWGEPEAKWMPAQGRPPLPGKIRIMPHLMPGDPLALSALPRRETVPTLTEEEREKVRDLLTEALDYTGQRYAPIDTEACNEYARLCDAAHGKITEALSLISKLTGEGHD